MRMHSNKKQTEKFHQTRVDGDFVALAYMHNVGVLYAETRARTCTKLHSLDDLFNMYAPLPNTVLIDLEISISQCLCAHPSRMHSVVKVVRVRRFRSFKPVGCIDTISTRRRAHPGCRPTLTAIRSILCAIRSMLTAFRPILRAIRLNLRAIRLTLPAFRPILPAIRPMLRAISCRKLPCRQHSLFLPRPLLYKINTIAHHRVHTRTDSNHWQKLFSSTDPRCRESTTRSFQTLY